MSPLPSRRSWLPLCLGLPGFLFLVWAWFYSNFQTSDLEYRPWGFEASSCEGHLVMAQLSPAAAAEHAVDRWEGVVYSTKVPELPPPPMPSGSEELSVKWTEGVDFSCDFGGAPPEDFSFSQSEVHPLRRTWWPPFRFQRSEDPTASFWLLAMPHWGLISAYLFAWAGLWRWAVWRSERRLLGMVQ